MANSLNYLRKSPGVLGDNIDRPRDMTGFAGGKNRYNQVFINGYYGILLSPPERLFNGLSSTATEAGASGAGVLNNELDMLSNANQYKDNGDSYNTFEAERWFHSACSGYSPHSRTLKTVDHIGKGGMNSSFIAGQDITRTFSLTFSEWQNLPIMGALRIWTNVIDPKMGISPLRGNEFIPANYKGDCYVAIFRPTASNGNNELAMTEDGLTQQISALDIEEVFYYTGVFPQALPEDVLNMDNGTNDQISLQVTFSFDGYPQTKADPWIIDRFVQEFNNRFGYASHYDPYLSMDRGEYRQPNSRGESRFGMKQNLYTARFGGIPLSQGLINRL
jgi:hypothetical protein